MNTPGTKDLGARKKVDFCISNNIKGLLFLQKFAQDTFSSNTDLLNYQTLTTTKIMMPKMKTFKATFWRGRASERATPLDFKCCSLLVQ